MQLKVIDTKTGKVIHTLRGLKASEAAKARREFYRVLVQKLKQKVEFKTSNEAA